MSITYHQTDSLDEALRAQDAGVDGIVLGGAEKGGGHSRDQLHTFALLQKARRCIDVPIVATGGIVDGYGMAAAFALGAEGVWMGTRFIASAECPWHDNYKQAIVDAQEVISIDMNLPIIPSMRAVRNEFAEAVARGEAGHKKNPYAGDAMKLFYEGRTDLALVGCGESAVLIDQVKPAGADHPGDGQRVLERDRAAVRIAQTREIRSNVIVPPCGTLQVFAALPVQIASRKRTDDCKRKPLNGAF